MSAADAYKPKPKTVWFSKLRRQFLIGVGVFDAANPLPIAGCITNSGMTTVLMPSAMADSNDGL